jgi:hypothetical protein
MTVLDLITLAFAEIGAYAQGEVPSAADAQFALQKLNNMLDSWNAQRLKVYTTIFAQYTLVPGLQPATIGPSGATYTVAQRPVRIDAANILLNNVVPYVKSPLNIRNDQFWQNNPVPTIGTTLPTDLYYSPAWPNGQLYLWPIPTVAYGLELWSWQLLSEYSALTTIVTLPPGYRNAIIYSLAVELSNAFGKAVSTSLGVLAMNAINYIQMNNADSPIIATTDSGIPSSSRKQIPSFNWRTGSSSAR